MNDKVLQALSLAKKAGALETGADAAKAALLKGAPLALISADASERTERSVRSWATKRIVKLDCTSDEIAYVLGRGFAAAAVTDINLSKLILDNTTATEGIEC